MKTKCVSFSLPVDLIEQLHELVEKQSLSEFACLALRKALLEKQAALKQEYIDAENDPINQETLKD